MPRHDFTAQPTPLFLETVGSAVRPKGAEKCRAEDVLRVRRAVGRWLWYGVGLGVSAVLIRRQAKVGG